MTFAAAVAVGLALALATCAAVEDAGTARAAAPAAASESPASSVSYRRWVAVWPRTHGTLDDYPLEITSQSGAGALDHAALVAAGKAQPDASDVRVLVDGVEVDRWLAYTNTDHTKVWVNLDLSPPITTTLAGAFASGDTLSSLAVAAASTFPSSGTLLNTATGEAFTYQGRDTTHFVGVTRAANGTAAAVGNGGDVLVWIEHDVAILYGGFVARDANDAYMPAFEVLTSTNTAWMYDKFGDDTGLRAAAWTASLAWSTFYGGDRGTAANPWIEIGLRNDAVQPVPDSFVLLSNPCGITNIALVGEKRADDSMGIAAWNMGNGNRLASSTDGGTWITEYNIPAPSAAATWQPWSRDEALAAQSTYVAIAQHPMSVWSNLECSSATVTLDASHTPGVSMAVSELAAGFVLATTTTPRRVTSGGQLAYSLRVTNSGQIDLHAHLTSTLSTHVTPSGTLTWTPVITAPGGVWSTAVTVTVAPDYIGPLDNLVRVTTDEGATAEYTATVTVYHHIYLPLAARDYTIFHQVADAPDTCAEGLPIQFAPHQYRENLDAPNDNDWWEVSVISGTSYTAEVYDLGPRADTVLVLHDGACTYVTENDDQLPGDPSSGSLVQWTATQSGVYRLGVRGYDFTVYGSGTGYTLRVYAGSVGGAWVTGTEKAPPLPTPLPGGLR